MKKDTLHLTVRKFRKSKECNIIVYISPKLSVSRGKKMNEFLDIYNLLKLNKNEINTINRYITASEI